MDIFLLYVRNFADSAKIFYICRIISDKEET